MKKGLKYTLVSLGSLVVLAGVGLESCMWCRHIR